VAVGGGGVSPAHPTNNTRRSKLPSSLDHVRFLCIRSPHSHALSAKMRRNLCGAHPAVFYHLAAEFALKTRFSSESCTVLKKWGTLAAVKLNS
jgi:hypothetical protein